MSEKKLDIRTIPGIGIICAIISVIFWSTAGLCIKLSDDVHALEVLTISAIIQSLIYLVVMLYQKSYIFGESNERIYLFLRCTFGTVSMACLYSSYRLISLSDGTTIRFTAPVFVSVFAFLLLREPLGPMQILNAGITIAGVLLIGRPSFLFNNREVMSSDTILGLALAFCSAIAIAISMTVMRKLQKTSSAVVIFWFSMATVLLGLVALWILDQYKWPSNTTVWIIIVMTGLSLAVDQLFITLALKLENAGPIAVVQALNVVISFIFSVTILDEKIRLTSFIGGALIFISIVITGIYKWYHDIKPTEEEADIHCKQSVKQISDQKVCSSREPVYIIRPIDPSDPYLLNYFEFKNNKRQQMLEI